MNIIYFTTTQDSKTYNDFRKLWKTKPNPSNQIFHNKLINSISLSHHVDIISLRPYSRRLVNAKTLPEMDKNEGNIHWHYLKVKKNKIAKTLYYLNKSLKICKSIQNDSLIFVDCINPLAVATAINVSKNLNLKIVGVCIDSPSNISGTRKSYTEYLLRNSQNLAGYITLTDELNEMFNESKAPSVVFDGIVDDSRATEESLVSGKYLFFGGSLQEKYGVYNLIEAYKASNHGDVQLIICGHQSNNIKLFEAINGDPNIKFLGSLTYEEVINLEKNAIACINPRPSTKDSERYSIPSKTLEYLYSGSVVISIKNNKLTKNLYENAIWAKSNAPEELTLAINKVLAMNKMQRNKMGKEAKEKVFSLYSFESINKKINALLEKIN